MGLCKCPKRQVTNQFCFEHRVNVCEHCMVTSHPKCIVQSYLQWLKDSDYDPSCHLCRNALEQGDCVRLICYHVFHWDCLNAREASLPANTAPSGHTCPVCNDHIFPTPNLLSPVADVLRSRLGQANWGRNELGLPLLAEKPVETNNRPMYGSASATISQKYTSHNNNIHSSSSNTNSDNSSGPNAASAPKAHSVLHMDSFSVQNDFQPPSSRRSLLPRVSPIGADYDDNKYQKRAPAEIFKRWTRRLFVPTARPIWRRTWFLILFGFGAFVLIIYFLAIVGRSGVNIDTDLDENPMVQHNL